MADFKLRLTTQAILLATATILLSSCGGGSGTTNNKTSAANSQAIQAAPPSRPFYTKARPLTLKYQEVLKLTDNYGLKASSKYYQALSLRSTERGSVSTVDGNIGTENSSNSASQYGSGSTAGAYYGSGSDRSANDNDDNGARSLDFLIHAESEAPSWDAVMYSRALEGNSITKDASNAYWNHYHSYDISSRYEVINARYARPRYDNVVTSDPQAHAESIHSLANNEDSKVLVIEPHYTELLKRDNSRVGYEQLPLGYGFKFNSDDQHDNVSHGDGVVTALFMNYNNTLRSKFGYYFNSRPYLHYDGFFAQKGKVKVLAHHKDGLNKSIVDSSGQDSFSVDALLAYDPIARAAAQGYNIVNLSFGNSYNKSDLLKLIRDEHALKPFSKPTWEQLLRAASGNEYKAFILAGVIHQEKAPLTTMLNLGKNHDVLFIEAQGNDEGSINTNPMVILNNPGKYKDVKDFYITVTAKDETNSNHKNTPCGPAKEYCVTAPQYAIGIYNRYLGGHRYQGNLHLIKGTSVAAPYVSGLAATIKAVYPFFDNHNIQQTILTTASKLDRYGNIVYSPDNNSSDFADDTWGWGMVNPVKAVNGPEVFRGKDFVVDLNHNVNISKSVSDPNYNQRVFSFNNDIRGDKGLIVRNSNPERTVGLLNLTGFNNYEGKTVVENGGRLNVDGAINVSEVVVKDGGQLSGRGSIATLIGEKGSRISTYSLANFNLRNRAPEAIAKLENYNNSLFISNIASFKEGSHLFVDPYHPLVAKEVVVDKAILHLAPKIEEFNEDGYAVQEVIYSQKGIKGEFAQINTPNSLTITDTYTSRIFQGADKGSSNKGQEDRATSLVAIISLGSAANIEREGNDKESAANKANNDLLYSNGTQTLDNLFGTLKNKNKTDLTVNQNSGLPANVVPNGKIGNVAKIVITKANSNTRAAEASTLALNTENPTQVATNTNSANPANTAAVPVTTVSSEKAESSTIDVNGAANDLVSTNSKATEEKASFALTNQLTSRIDDLKAHIKSLKSLASYSLGTLSNKELSATATYLAAAEYQDALYLSNNKFRNFTSAAISEGIRNRLYFQKPYSVKFSGNANQFRFDSHASFTNSVGEFNGHLQYHRGSFETSLTSTKSKYNNLALSLGYNYSEYDNFITSGVNFNYSFLSSSLQRQGYAFQYYLNQDVNFKAYNYGVDLYLTIGRLFGSLSTTYTTTSSDVEKIGDYSFQYQSEPSLAFNLKVGYEYSFDSFAGSSFDLKAHGYADFNLNSDYKAKTKLTDSQGYSIYTDQKIKKDLSNIAFYQEMSLSKEINKDLQAEIFGYCSTDFREKHSCGAGVTLIFGK